MDYKQNSNCWYADVCENFSDCCIENCIRYAEMKYLMDSSNIPLSRQFPDSLIAGDDLNAYRRLAEIKSNMTEFVNKGSNLYITSQFTGNGKTSWAIKLMSKYFDEIWAGNGFNPRGLFLHIPTLLLQLKDFDNPISSEFKQSILKADLVVFDDIASTELSKYDYTQLLMYIDQRIFNCKANIFTGNLNNPIEFEKALGSKLFSRVWNTSEIIEFVGKDRRGTYGTVTDS